MSVGTAKQAAAHSGKSWSRPDNHALALAQLAATSTALGNGILHLPWNMPSGILFHYKIDPVCGILIGSKKTPSCAKSMIASPRHMSSHPRTSAPRAADNDRNKRGDSSGPGTAVISKTRTQVKKPSFYRVLLLNDDYTPMEFVVHVLERFFNKDREAATRIMLHVHHHGIGECGIYTYEVAETKVTQVMDFARKHQHPLQCVMEKK